MTKIIESKGKLLIVLDKALIVCIIYVIENAANLIIKSK